MPAHGPASSSSSSTAAAAGSSSSLLSNVFSFVSREFESFVHNAAGRSSETNAPAPIPTPSLRVESRPKTNKNPSKAGRVHKTHAVDPTPAIGSRRRPRSSPGPPTPPRHRDHARKATSSVSVQDKRHAKQHLRSTKNPPPPSAPHKNANPHNDHAPSSPHLPSLLRKPSLTMPGSLFSRSASPDPDRPTHAHHPDTEERHVHFTPKSSNSRHVQTRHNARRGPANSDTGSGSGSDSDDTLPTRRRTLPSSLVADTTELRPRTIPSVKAVVQRFCADEDSADPSLLLPIISPRRTTTMMTRTASQTTISAVDGSGGGQQHSFSLSEPREDDDETELESSSCRLMQTSRQVEKGKQRAHEGVTNRSHSTERRSASEMAVRGKERELVAAREEHDRNERRWERDKHAAEAEQERRRDKERIRALEREIALLKEELSKRPAGPSREFGSDHQHPFPRLPSPPPAPPAPPAPHGLFSNTTSRSDINTDTLFGSARAALKQTALPVEAPINPVFGSASGRTRRQGQPTVNVPSDKMAAFLNEIKTARLRKVSSMQGLARSNSDGASAGAIGSNSALLRRASAAGIVHVPKTLNRTMGRREEAVRVGEKRKRSENSDLIGREAPSKRRSPVPSTSKSLSRSFPSSSSSSSVRQANRTWPSISITTETDVTTPSLCSDNDGERTDDILPATPPDAQVVTKKHAKPPREIIDVDMDDEAEAEVVVPAMLPPPQPPRSTEQPMAPSPLLTAESHISPRVRRMGDILAKRPPTSPMPNPSPRKPRPPARTSVRNPSTISSARLTERDASDEEEGDEGDLPALTSAAKTVNTTTSRQPKAHPPRYPQEPSGPLIRGSSKTSSRIPRRQVRRPTLEEEFRIAGEREWAEEVGAGADVDSGVLVGVGTKDKREGFLAHGGAGGIPVFMGVGYVAGVEEVRVGDDVVHEHNDEQEDEEEHRPRRRRIGNRRRWQTTESLDD